MQTNFVCKCRQKGARFADKVRLQMQTNFADESFQDTSPQNADKLLQKCRRARCTFGGIADKLCRQSLSTLNLGTSAFWFVYSVLQSSLQRSAKFSAEMQTKFVYMHEQVCLYFLISLNESLVRAASHSELVQQPVRVELLLGSN